MNLFNVVNYHITNRCNYSCAYCFGKFDKQKDPSLSEAKSVIDSIALYFLKSNISNGRVNFAGGEPTLYAHFDELIDYTDSLGIQASIVTNGSLLTPERICDWRKKVSCIGLSIDSIVTDTNLMIGRCHRGKASNLACWKDISNAIHASNIDLKINTVVSRLNVNEDLSELYQTLEPNKIKLFQMHLVKGINDKAQKYAITEDEFAKFCKRHKAFDSIIVAEPHTTMENSYLMVNPQGEFQLNNNGEYQTFGSLIDIEFSKILSFAPLDY